jgi:hypothetical protein
MEGAPAPRFTAHGGFMLVAAASNIPTLNFARNAKFRMGHPAKRSASFEIGTLHSGGYNETACGTNDLSGDPG